MFNALKGETFACDTNIYKHVIPQTTNQNKTMKANI